MTRMKYVVVETPLNDLPIVFSEMQEHADYRVFGKITSAGFCSVSGDKWQCWGRSISVGVEAAPTDGDLLTRCLPLE